MPANPLSTNSRETLIHAVEDPTIRSRPISVNELSTTVAVAPSESETSASASEPPRNSSS